MGRAGGELKFRFRFNLWMGSGIRITETAHARAEAMWAGVSVLCYVCGALSPGGDGM